MKTQQSPFNVMTVRLSCVVSLDLTPHLPTLIGVVFTPETARRSTPAQPRGHVEEQRDKDPASPSALQVPTAWCQRTWKHVGCR